MKTKITIVKEDEPPTFGSLKLGECFTYLHPATNAVYMKVSDGNLAGARSVNLATGSLYDIASTKHVCPVEVEIVARYI